jgi:hypothetical protein
MALCGGTLGLPRVWMEWNGKRGQTCLAVRTGARRWWTASRVWRRAGKLTSPAELECPGPHTGARGAVLGQRRERRRFFEVDTFSCDSAGRLD